MNLEQDIIFFDLETTGIDLANDRIIEISAIKLGKDLEQVGVPIERRINPDGREIHPEAQEIHGISMEDLKGEKTFKEVAPKLFQFFEGCALGGYNILNFDIPMLIEEFKRCDLDFSEVASKAKIVDPFKIMSKKERRTLSWAYQFYTNKTMEDAHNATQDNLATIEIFKDQAIRYEFDNWLNDADDLTRKDEDGNQIIDFGGMFLKTSDGQFIFGRGKHKGKKVNQDMDTLGYMKWIVERSDFNNNTKYAAEKLYKWGQNNVPVYNG